MTNEQLAVLLEQYCARLGAALEQAEAALPQDIERESEWRYVKKKATIVEQFFSSPLTHPDDWEEYSGAAVALGPVREVVNSLNIAISQLSKDVCDCEISRD